MLADGETSFLLKRQNNDFGDLLGKSNDVTTRFAAGLKGTSGRYVALGRLLSVRSAHERLADREQPNQRKLGTSGRRPSWQPNGDRLSVRRR